MQTRDNLERMVVIKAFIAVRMLGLRQEGISEETQNDSCKKILTPTEWKLLWVKLEGKQLPSQTPTLKWACLKLGRWHDSKRTGRPGWVVMWDGWFRLQDMVEGYPVMKSLDQEIGSRDSRTGRFTMLDSFNKFPTNRTTLRSLSCG